MIQSKPSLNIPALLFCALVLLENFILFAFSCPQDPATSRTLTLISKTIQTLGSLAKSKSVSFSAQRAVFLFSFLSLSWTSFVFQSKCSKMLTSCLFTYFFLCPSRPISKSLTWLLFTTTSTSRNMQTLWRMWVFDLWFSFTFLAFSEFLPVSTHTIK